MGEGGGGGEGGYTREIYSYFHNGNHSCQPIMICMIFTDLIDTSVRFFDFQESHNSREIVCIFDHLLKTSPSTIS